MSTSPPTTIGLSAHSVGQPGASRRSQTLAWALQRLANHAWFIEDEVAGLAGLIRAGDVCLDIGAEYGLYTQVMASLVGPDGIVVACEPQLDAAAVLLTGVTLVSASHVRLCTVALADQSGHAELHTPLRHGRPVHGRAHLSTGQPPPDDPNIEFTNHRYSRVPVTTLDELVAAEGLHRVDYLKVDVEGAEARVLTGAKTTLERHRPRVQLEIEARFTPRAATTPEAIVAHMTEQGYQLHAWQPDRWTPAARVTPTRRNYLFIPR